MTSRVPQVLSADKIYEYEFRRVWDPSAPLALWVMRNPSKIDNLEPGDVPVPADGKTVARCADFSRREGWGGLITWNLFAYRAADARELPCGLMELLSTQANEETNKASHLVAHHMGCD